MIAGLGRGVEAAHVVAVLAEHGVRAPRAALRRADEEARRAQERPRPGLRARVGEDAKRPHDARDLAVPADARVLLVAYMK